MPVGRVKALNPLGHSGHLKLQLVVGSNETEMGYPHCIGFLSHWLNWKLLITFNTFQMRLIVSFLNKFLLSLKLNSGIQQI